MGVGVVLKRLVIKTSLITLASFIGALVITFSALCLFAPATLAGFFDDVGSYSASVFFYEKQCDISGDVKDLEKLFIKVNQKGDYVATERIAKKIIEHKDFESYSIEDKEYYYGYYVLSLAKNGKFTNAIESSSVFVERYSYTEFNPFRVLITDYVKEDMTEQKAQLKTAIESTTNVDSLFQIGYKLADLLVLNA